MDLEPLIRSYAKSFITSADLTSLVTALIGMATALWLGKRITTFAVRKGFSISWGVAKWLFTSRPLGEVAAEIMRAMDWQICCAMLNSSLSVGKSLCIYPYSKRVTLDEADMENVLSHHERKHISRKAASIRAAIDQYTEKLNREHLIGHLRGGTRPNYIVYYKGGQVLTETVKKDEPKQPTPTVTPSADGQPMTTWNRALSAEEMKAEYERAKAAASKEPLILPPGTKYIPTASAPVQGGSVSSSASNGTSVCTCEADEECDICRGWAERKMAAADRRLPK